jgi:formylglycine-generating enzyme required for sulfatase activity
MSPAKDSNAELLFHNDEPAPEDGLDRGGYARSFARLAVECQTPMVVGLYGTWGVGKTTLMRHVRDELHEDGIPTVWFDPWQHQFDENPLIALLQKAVVDLGKETVEDLKAILTTVALALGSPVLKWAYGLSVKDVKTMADEVAEESYRIRGHQIEIRTQIEKLISKARKKDKPLVFFIDDLDRCLPETMIRMLEGLKLYLDIPGCVYFLGLDHATVKKGIETKYAELAISDRDYLDKIVQMPFLIPRIHEKTALPWIAELLPEDAKPFAEDLAEFLGDNPRQLKRYVNNLSLHLLLAGEIFGAAEAFNTGLAVALLLIQHKNEALFKQISVNPRLYFELKSEGEDAPEIAEDLFGGDTQLQRLIQRVEVPEDTPIEKYVHLADVAGASVREQRTLAIEPEMVTLEPGTFTMGSDERGAERPPHEVAIPARFQLGRYPVTFDEYDRFAEATGRKRPDDDGWGRARRPAINVSWEDARAYAEWLAKETKKPYRLPSEAEWEYACRAGTTTRYAFGDELTESQANFDHKIGKTTPVGDYPPNAWGLHDMHGNVWEWVEDCWNDSYQGAPGDGSARTEGDCSRRVLRGGSWSYDPRVLRSANRSRSTSHYRYSSVGFRVARTLP